MTDEVDEDDDEGGEETSLFDGEAFLLEGPRATCERFGLLGLLIRDGFLYGYRVGEGEVLFHDVLKKHKDSNVAAMQVVKR